MWTKIALYMLKREDEAHAAKQNTLSCFHEEVWGGRVTVGHTCMVPDRTVKPTIIKGSAHRKLLNKVGCPSFHVNEDCFVHAKTGRWSPCSETKHTLASRHQTEAGPSKNLENVQVLYLLQAWAQWVQRGTVEFQVYNQIDLDVLRRADILSDQSASVLCLRSSHNELFTRQQPGCYCSVIH